MATVLGQEYSDSETVSHCDTVNCWPLPLLGVGVASRYAHGLRMTTHTLLWERVSVCTSSVRTCVCVYVCVCV